MNNEDFAKIQSLKKDIMLSLDMMIIARYESDFENAYDYLKIDVMRLAQIIYNARYKMYHEEQEEVDE